MGPYQSRFFKQAATPAGAATVLTSLGTFVSPDLSKKNDSKKEKGSIGKGLKKLLKTIAAPVKLIAMAVDFTASFTTTYFSMYSLLTHATESLTETDLSPSASLQRTLFSTTNGNPNFIIGSRHILYPLCVYSVFYNSVTNQKTLDQDFSNRREACIKLIKKFEGLSTTEEIANVFPEGLEELAAALIDNKRIHLDKNLYNKIIEQSFNFPEDYIVTWLTALRSVHGLIKIPHIYWDLEQKMIVRSVTPTNSFLSPIKLSLALAPSQIATYSNTDRLNYTISLLSVTRYREENKTEGKTLKPNDPIIAKNINT